MSAILFSNNEASVGLKRSSNKEQCVAQGDFYYSPADSLIYIYSAATRVYLCTYRGRPTTSSGAYPDGLVGIHGKNYLTIRNLDLRYAGSHGFRLENNPTHVTIENCDVSFMGGSFLKDSTRYGNGVELWEGGTDITVHYCTFKDIYDAGVTVQGLGGGWTRRESDSITTSSPTSDTLLSFGFATDPLPPTAFSLITTLLFVLEVVSVHKGRTRR